MIVERVFLLNEWIMELGVEFGEGLLWIYEVIEYLKWKLIDKFIEFVIAHVM